MFDFQSEKVGAVHSRTSISGSFCIVFCILIILNIVF